MPSESDSPIEQKLRAYAEHRRGAASEEEFKIHPVTRNSLKVEVVKQYGRRLPGERNEPSIWASLWPKLALAVSGFLILFLAVAVFRPNHSPEQYSQLDEETAASELLSVEPPSPVPSASEFNDLQARTKLAAPNNPVNEQVFQFFPMANTNSTAVSSNEPRRMALAETDSGVNTVDRSTSVNTAGDAASVGAALVLASFQVRLRGDQVVVIDEDSSEYVGNILPINPDILAGIARRIGPESLGDTSDPGFPTNYRLYSEQGGNGGAPSAGRFRVVGVNKTSGRTLEFTGTMITWTQALSASGQPRGEGPASIVRIQGSASVSGEPTVTIDATTQSQ